MRRRRVRQCPWVMEIPNNKDISDHNHDHHRWSVNHCGHQRSQSSSRCQFLFRTIELCVTSVIIISSICGCDGARDFEPYQLNGGLVTAVAGRNFCITASDTRMIGEGGYLLLSRNHVANRLWSIADSQTAGGNHYNPEDNDNQSDTGWNEDDTIQLGDDLETFLRDYEWHNGRQPGIERTAISRPVSTSQSSVVVIGSSGCSTDCFQLKLDMQTDYKAATSFGQMAVSCNTNSVANLLSQTLYTRRGMPYYTFCVVGGLEVTPNQAGINPDGSSVTAKAFVYDAIGSYEQVAVASAGTGRELLQPILDRMFARSNKIMTTSYPAESVLATQSVGDIQPSFSRRQKPSLHVDCTTDEAVSILCQAYRSVSEREIGVGDTVVLHISEVKDGGGIDSRILVVPLKRH